MGQSKSWFDSIDLSVEDPIWNAVFWLLIWFNYQITHLNLRRYTLSSYSSQPNSYVCGVDISVKASTLVPGASNKMAEWLIDWVRNFSPWTSAAMEAVKETKFGTKVR